MSNLIEFTLDPFIFTWQNVKPFPKFMILSFLASSRAILGSSSDIEDRFRSRSRVEASANGRALSLMIVEGDTTGAEAAS
jgi:hypothetical protein